MSKGGNIESLGDIKEAIKRIGVYIENLDYKDFLKMKNLLKKEIL